MAIKIGKWLEDQFVKLAIKKLSKKIANMKGSWKTTLYGLLAALGTMGTQIMNMIDDDPNTNLDVKVLVGALMTAIALFKMGQSARDKEVSTEQEIAAKAAKTDMV